MKEDKKTSQVDLRLVKDIHKEMGLIYGERYRDYRNAWDAASNLEKTPEFPLDIEFEQNSSCNLYCDMCLYRSPFYHKFPQRDRILSRELYEKVIDEGSRYNLPAITFGVLSEPFLSKDLVKLIKYASDKGVIDSRVGTNGTLLEHFINEELMDSGLARLEISLDAFTKTTYEKIRRGGDFDKVKKNIFDFLELREKLNRKLPFLRVSFLKRDDSIDELEPFVEYWAKYADYISIQSLVDYSNLEDIDYRSVGPMSKEYRCPQPFQRITILSNGDVLPCCSVYGFNLVMGNVKECSVYDIWHSDKFNALRQVMKSGEYARNPFCYHCIENTML